MPDNIEEWPPHYPSPSQVVDASLAAANQDEEFEAFARLGVAEEDWGILSHLVGIATHGAWLASGVENFGEVVDHPVYRVARRRALEQIEAFSNKRNPTAEEKVRIDAIREAQRPRDFFGNKHPSLKQMAIVEAVIAFVVVSVIAFGWFVLYQS